MGQYRMLVDVTKCIGCYSCRVACQMENDLPSDQSYISFCEVEKGEYPNVEWVMHRFSCLHCEDAVCEKVCPQNAISYSQTGAVVVDQEQCIGCEYCEKNCPFGRAKVELCQDKEGNSVSRANKCTLCNGKVLEGVTPACASTCYTKAIVFGESDEILQKAEQRLAEVKDRYPDANIYNPEGVGGTHTIYLLAHKPEEYDLESDAATPASAIIWKDYAQPLGKLLLGATTMAVIGGAISNRLFNKGEHHEGGE
ncbi:4Fe-4S dicluster domain-containing protein [Salipaludibacillus aurantiacus]|uniref:Formate dehydrogenase iron-sulfur subunit n=1 Tax=Salipaludibacillus aurantiacus TaxID=1601833 RepID=A0A1H9S9L5_9BACI|nr:4Fe-4S dicluster domain-containing protein [Salipaludibacillus aurantiacus]SER81726.1 formate dehydrogenase iron-sulfur subunit [Salipaludibacillus aurantiacus]